MRAAATGSIACLGGGPAGLYLAILAKRAHPSRRVIVFERNRADDTFGFGVIFSDQTLESFGADPDSHREILAASVHWTELDVYLHGERITSTGHGFSGLGRKRMLAILQARAAALGVELRFSEEPDLDALQRDFDLVVAADGVNSGARERHQDALGPQIEHGRNRFVWLGSTQPLSAFTFYFDRNDDGLFRVHAYRYDAERSTFIVECTDETFTRAGLSVEDEAATVAYCERLFAHRLGGHRLLTNRSLWRRFPTVRNRSWVSGNLVVLGDAAHTAHFSIGSGTKLAIDDAIALARSIDEGGAVAEVLARYEAGRRPQVERLQRAAETSLHWFEETERYFDKLDPLTFTYSLLSRSLRIDHDNLRVRDAQLCARVDEAFAARAGAPRRERPASPMFAPLDLRGLRLPNRIGTAPMAQEAAEDGLVGDWHLVHYGGLATGGAGLVLAEQTAISSDGRLAPGTPGLWSEAHAAAWGRIVAFVHARSHARVGVQLGHAGRRALGEAGTLLSATARPFAAGHLAPIPIGRAEMDALVAAFVHATRLALVAGFDLVELQLGHGHLLADFLSPLVNDRADDHGGTLLRRMRFPLEVVDAVRAAWPAERPLVARISASDHAPGGLAIEEAVELAHTLAAHGCDLIDVSSGETDGASAVPGGRLYHAALAERIRLDAGVRTMSGGGVRTAGECNMLLAAARTDVCLLGRQHLLQPRFTLEAALREGADVVVPAAYEAVRAARR